MCRSFNLTNNLNFTLETQFVEISISPEPELTIAAVVLNKGELTRLGAQTSTFQTEQKSWIIKVSNLKEKVDSLLLSLEIKSCMGFNGMFDVFGTRQLIARSGYSKQGGFEIYLQGGHLGSDLFR